MLNHARINTVDPIRAFANEIDRFFADHVSAPATSAANRTALIPPINVWHDDNAVSIEAELPGLRLEDIEILVSNDQITLRGERNASHPEDATPLRTERRPARFERTITLPDHADLDNATATLENGLLLISIPKSSESRVKRITISNTDNEQTTP